MNRVEETNALTTRARIVACINKIPRGKVSTYGAVARAAGLGRGARQVASLLRHSSQGLPWHRVVGAGGEIKLRGNASFEQRLRLEMEGLKFRGRRVDMSRYEVKFPRSKNASRSRHRPGTSI
jgi:methylated-DNA-protein-cysteine methyltransferase-like protein